MRPGPFRRLALLLLLVPLAVLAGAAALVLAADPLLAVRSALKPADAIVVLGGDGPRRAARAAALFRDGVAPRILVTGDGDCLSIRDELVRRGVPPPAVEVECLSRNTMENAAFSAPILVRMEARRVVLVTSWFHMRRALACFDAVAPRLALLAAPVEPAGGALDRLADADAPRVAAEYVKLGWYALRYGVLPFHQVARGTGASIRHAGGAA